MPTMTAHRLPDEINTYDEVVALHRTLCRKVDQDVRAGRDPRDHVDAAARVARLGHLLRKVELTDPIRDTASRVVTAIRDGAQDPGRPQLASLRRRGHLAGPGGPAGVLAPQSAPAQR